MEELHIAGDSTARVPVLVWRDEVAALDAGEVPAAWWSTYLGRPARMVRFPADAMRACSREWAGGTGAHTAFADGYPLLIVGAASLEDLNRRLAAKHSPALPMNRFRPNIVVAGLEPYDEDRVSRLSSGGCLLVLVKPCTRCRITTTDQATAAMGGEPLRELAAYRLNERVGGVTFGMNAIVAAGAGGQLRVGAPLETDWSF